MFECKNDGELFQGAAAGGSKPPPSKTEVQRFRDWLTRMTREGATTKHGTLKTLLVLPWMAEVILERNTGNRPVNGLRVKEYAKDIALGKWLLTGHGIVVSRESILNDGQHRLLACIEAGVGFLTDIRFGIERQAFEVTDCGAKRTLGHVFAINGEKSAKLLAAALGWLNDYSRGFSGRKLTHVDGVALLEEHPEMRDSVEAGALVYKKSRLMEPSLTAFLHYMTVRSDPMKAQDFWGFMADGIGVTDRRDPRHKLRERLLLNNASKARISSMEIAALTIKAWNAFKEGRGVGFLKWQNNPSKNLNEPFPRVQ